MPQLVFDVLCEIAVFCAGAFDFRTLVNLSLTCKAMHQAIRPVLDHPVLVLSQGSHVYGVQPEADNPWERIQ
jgi:hypothetical protein